MYRVSTAYILVTIMRKLITKAKQLLLNVLCINKIIINDSNIDIK